MIDMASSRTYRGVDIHHQVRQHVLLRVVRLFESNPIPFRDFREATPIHSQSIRPVIPHVPGVTLDVLELNRLTGSMTRFEDGEDVIDEFLVDYGFSPRGFPTFLAPVKRPFGQRCVEVLMVSI